MPNNWTFTGFFGVIGLHTILLTLFLPLPIFFHVAIYYKAPTICKGFVF